MAITKAQFDRIAGHFPVQRGNVKTENYAFINAILYMAENGCKWRALPTEYGKWATIYKKFNRWAKNESCNESSPPCKPRKSLRSAWKCWPWTVLHAKSIPMDTGP